jgi:hypothetical protein
MSKIRNLTPLGPDDIDGSELTPVSKDGQTFRAPIEYLGRAAAERAERAAERLEDFGGADEVSASFGDGTKWLRMTPDEIEHPQIDEIDRDLSRLASVTSPQSVAGGADEVSASFDDGTKWLRMTPDQMQHPEIARIKHQIFIEGLGGQDPALSSMATLAERLGLHLIGQSLALGNSALPPISTTPNLYADMFNGGLVPDGANIDIAALLSNRASLTPLIETTRNIDPFSGGETPLSGAVAMIVQLLREEDGVDLLSDLNMKFLAASDGHGGARIDGIKSTGGTDCFVRIQASMQQGAALFNAAGRSYAPAALLWLQGEGDNVFGSTQAEYFSDLGDVMAEYQGISDGILGFNRPLPFVLMQTSSHPAASVARPQVALAQLEFGQTLPAIFAGSLYPCPAAGTALTQVHLSNLGSIHAGAYYGLAIKRALFDQVRVPPLVPVITAQGNKIIAKFPVAPGRRIVGGATIGDISLLSNWGVGAVDAGGVAKALTNPRVAGRDTIVWDAPETPADAWKFQAAFVGNTRKGFTNIRDDSTILFDPDGVRLPMQQWMPICEVSLT